MSKHDPRTAEAARDAVPVAPALRDGAEAPAAAARAPEPQAPAKPKRSGRRKAILAALGLAALGAGGYEGWHYWTVGRFMVETDDAYVQSDITLISSRVQGYVAALPVDENTHVKAGDVLVQLDDGDYRIALATARSRVATADRTLARIDAQIEAARAAIDQAIAGQHAAEATLKNASISLDRAKDLVSRKVAAQAQLDAATEAYDTASANLASTQAAVESARAQVDVLAAQRAESEGAKHELELAVDQAERNLDLTTLRAPVDGTLANLAVETGDLAAPGARLAALVPDDGYYIEANFKETQMPGVAPGERVEITFDALPDRSFEGTIASTAPATGSIFSLLPAENATGNFTKVVQRVPVRIEIPMEAQESGALRAGLSAIVSVDLRTAPGGDAAAARPASAPAGTPDAEAARVASAR
ncbi:HlyD family secretion protein [Albimonas sp. CAU 1670]|uniref:HlyD family secretion protein n=1 Tax=Albimonas sp. CAU 1670 TaxID=3032599 RepID=UPI0023DA8602|nr:HlyD family secretion protein [Albimonas sp. CAU 1670]MDF2233719.1 HlyD family secretion protein [Albimonas sp. CAU 1670]